MRYPLGATITAPDADVPSIVAGHVESVDAGDGVTIEVYAVYALPAEGPAPVYVARHGVVVPAQAPAAAPAPEAPPAG